jgi:uncharacterized membrane protein YdjX (TVP38/TMEM64 family)
MVSKMTDDPNRLNDLQPPLPDEAETEANAQVPWRKILLLAAVVGVLLAVVYFSPLREHLERLRDIKQAIRSFGWMAPVVLMVSVAVLVAVGFPRLWFCVLAGMALGFWSGLLWTQLGTLVGNYAVFLLVRGGGGDWARRYLSKRGRLHNLMHEEGIPGVILARQLPVPGLIINLVCGLFAIRHRDYLIGTILGQLPAAIPCTLIGAGLLKPSFEKSLGLIVAAVVVAVVAWIALRSYLRRRRANAPPP